MELTGEMKKAYSNAKAKELLTKIKNKNISKYRDYITQVLLSRIEKVNGCWIWKGALTGNGYGRIKIKGKNELSHRVSYELYNGKIPKGMEICHSCDNPKCVNPKHLWIGTKSENMKDAYKKGRIPKHCLTGHKGESNCRSKLTEQDVVFIKKNHKIITAKKLAEKFNVHPRTIQKVWYCEGWKHVSVVK